MLLVPRCHSNRTEHLLQTEPCAVDINKIDRAGIVLQGVVFGLAHAYQGPIQIIVIVVFGCMFGLLAHWRKSLRPGMTAHFLQDAVGGLVLAHFMPK